MEFRKDLHARPIDSENFPFATDVEGLLNDAIKDLQAANLLALWLQHTLKRQPCDVQRLHLLRLHRNRILIRDPMDPGHILVVALPPGLPECLRAWLARHP